MSFKIFLNFVNLSRSDPGIELLNFEPEIAGKQNFLITFASESALIIGSDYFGIVSVLDLPAQLILEQISRALLHQNIFRILVTHLFFSTLSNLIGIALIIVRVVDAFHKHFPVINFIGQSDFQ